jgi:hypothetical protein
MITTKKEIMVAVKDGFIKILSLQFPGKKKMLDFELLNGIHFSENAIAKLGFIILGKREKSMKNAFYQQNNLSYQQIDSKKHSNLLRSKEFLLNLLL